MHDELLGRKAEAISKVLDTALKTRSEARRVDWPEVLLESLYVAEKWQNESSS